MLHICHRDFLTLAYMRVSLKLEFDVKFHYNSKCGTESSLKLKCWLVHIKKEEYCETNETLDSYETGE